ncbi:MAG: leucine-rich repeat domain-containing protein [Bacteroidetes bacterium]|nr:leucine-rich repeat domain-containing protein [Bacteroidota bacterium]
MTSSLTKKLHSVYTLDNLHKITAKIIEVYRDKQYDALREIYHLTFFEDLSHSGTVSKLFYRLMMQYHPDRFIYFKTEIDRLFQVGDTENLKKLSRISEVLSYNNSRQFNNHAEIDETFAASDIWNKEEFEFEEEIENEELIEDDGYVLFEETNIKRNDFYSVLKRNIYGSKNIELPFYYLEDFNTLDMAGYALDDLDGIKHCKNLITIDLSDNNISDVSELSTINNLQEVYLNNNTVGYIDGLAYLIHLRILDISFNKIDDISPLLSLTELEYINIVGNNISLEQIKTFKEKGIVVVY